MQFTRPLARRKNLLLCLDAFNTIYEPSLAVPAAYAFAGNRHGIKCVADTTASKPVTKWTRQDYDPVYQAFKEAYKREEASNPNYGKATGLGAEKWWRNIIRGTFQPFLEPDQEVPETLVAELLKRYSSHEGYHFFPDAKKLFDMIKAARTQSSDSTPWKWNKTIVGIITNSDDRVPSILSSMGLQVGPRRAGASAQRISEASVEDDVSFVVLSYDVGYEKPDRRIFKAAEDMLSKTIASAPSSAGLGSVDDYEKVHVGDSVEKDYFGAQRAKWHAVVVDRSENVESKDGDEERQAPIATKLVLVRNAYTCKSKKVKFIRGLDELVEWNPKNRWRGERAGRMAME